VSMNEGFDDILDNMTQQALANRSWLTSKNP
jgi:hypothetical protein